MGKSPPTNVTLFAGCTAEEASTAFSQIAETIQAIFPADCNIVVVGPNESVPQPHKTVVVHAGKHYVNGEDSHNLGVTGGESCHPRNDSPDGESGVYIGAIRESIFDQFVSFIDSLYSNDHYDAKYDWGAIALPLSPGQIAMLISDIALHETCHAMGLVPEASANYGGHNDCQCGAHYMDSGAYRTMPMHLGVIPYLRLGWHQNNIRYLKFVLPVSIPE